MSKINASFDDVSQLGELEGNHLLLHRKVLGFDIKLSRAQHSWRGQKRRRVAVVLFHEKDVWGRRAAKGLLSSICNALTPEPFPEFDIFSADANSQFLQEEVCKNIEARQDEYAFVATIGSWVSKQVHLYATTNNWTVPRLFVGVHDPVESTLVPGLEMGSSQVVGVAEAPKDFGHQVALLKVLRPELKTILIPFDPSFRYDGFDKDKRRLNYHLEQNGIAVREVAVMLHGDITEQLQHHLRGVDMIWVLSDPATRIQIKKLVSLCKQEGITLMTSELASLFQGAALGFGDSGSRTGAFAGQLGFALLTGQRTPNELPVVIAQHPKVLRVNPNAYEQQGVELGKAQRALLQEVIPLGWE